MGSDSTRICVRCVMDTTQADIEFDDAGVCNFCRGYFAREEQRLPLPQRLAKLEHTLERIRRHGRGREFDCALGLSGGVDSSYLALLLKDWGIRVLAIQVDNGWNSELAVHNIEMLCRKLGMGLYTEVVDWDEFRALQVAFLRASVANFEAPSDHLIFASCYKVVARRGIKYLISGVNSATESIGSSLWGWAYGDLRQLKGIYRWSTGRKLRQVPMLSPVTREMLIATGRVEVVQPLDLIDYNPVSAVRELEERVGWRRYAGKHHESIITRFFQCYVFPRKTGMDKRRAHLSNLICSGHLSREDALRELANLPADPEQLASDKRFVAKKLGLEESELDRLIEAPLVSHRAYPNSERLLRLLSYHSNMRGGVAQLLRRLGFSVRGSKYPVLKSR